MAKPCLSVPSSEPARAKLTLLRDTTVWSVGGDSSIEVRTTVLSGWCTVTVPSGSIDEVGHKLLDVLNVWENQLPHEGRVFLVHEG